MPIILLFVFSCSGSNNDSAINNNLDNSAKHDLPKIECVDKLEAYILKAETLGQKDIDQITKWVCVSEKLFFNHPQTNFQIVNPIYIAALDRNNLDSAIELEQIWCEHIKKKIIVRTAGAAGIGSDMAKSLSKAGAAVIIGDKDEIALKRLEKEGSDILAIQADVSNESDVAMLFETVKSRFGKIDALINNAGIPGPSVKLEDIDLKDWEEAIKVNLTGTFLCSKSAIQLLKESGGGSIINIGSTSSFMGTPLRSAYTASKWGLIGLTKTWAMEYGKDKIRVNTICPTSVSGERIEGVIERDAEYRKIDPEKIRQAYLDQTSLKTFIDSEEIVGMVVYLLSPLAKNISGQMMVIDGHTETLAMPEFSEE